MQVVRQPGQTLPPCFESTVLAATLQRKRQRVPEDTRLAKNPQPVCAGEARLSDSGALLPVFLS